MERLSINDPPAGPQQGNAPPGFPPQQQQQQQQQQQNNTLGPMSHGPPQLPPQMFTTAAQLLDLTDSMFQTLGAHAPLHPRLEEKLLSLANRHFRETRPSFARWKKVDWSLEKLGSIR